jgi:hypothetical protein
MSTHVYRVTLDAWSHKGGPTHHLVLAVQGRDPEQVRQWLHWRAILGWQPSTETYSANGGLGPGAVMLDEHMITGIRRSRARGRDVPITQVSLCTDCFLVLCNGECGERPEELPEPLCKLAGHDLTPGVLRHNDECEYDKGNREAECHCEDLGFHTSWCLGCGDWHHGDRFAALIWERQYGGLELYQAF